MISRILDRAGPVVAGLILIRLMFEAARPEENPDVFLHMVIGERLGWPWQWDGIGQWSPFATAEWVPTQPLSEVVLYAAESIAGLPGLAWLHGLTLAIFVATVYRVTRQRASSLAAAFAVCFATIGSTGLLASPRPQLFGMILLLWTLALWLNTAQDGQPRWLLVPLAWFFAMVHGYWAIGLVLSGCIAVSLIVGKRLGFKSAAPLIGVCAASLAVSLLTPIGPSAVKGLFIVRDRAQLITEWQRTDLTAIHTWIVAAVIALPAVVAIAKHKVAPEAFAVLAAATFLLFYSERTADLAVVLAAPFAGAALDSLRGRTETRRSQRPEWIGLGLLACASLAALAVTVPFTADHESPELPTGLSKELDAFPDGTVVFNTDKVGGWLDWRHPNLSPTVDGLMDAYTLDYLRHVAVALQGGEQWRQTVDSTGANFALLPLADGLAPKLIDAGWTTIGTDAGVVLLAR